MSGATPIPVENAEGGWVKRVVATLGQLVRRPAKSFTVCPEPVDHGRVLKFLATLRLPLWALLVAWLSFGFLTRPDPEPIPTRAVHIFVDPALAEALSTWFVLMIPVGVPMLYFVGGLLAHIGIALTGGAPRSIGASMRAVGYALGPALLAIGLVDLPLYLDKLEGVVYLAILGAVALCFLIMAGLALARTHRIAVARGFLVALLPLITLVGASLGRASLELRRIPMFPVPSSPYYVP